MEGLRCSPVGPFTNYRAPLRNSRWAVVRVTRAGIIGNITALLITADYATILETINIGNVDPPNDCAMDWFGVDGCGEMITSEKPSNCLAPSASPTPRRLTHP